MPPTVLEENTVLVDLYPDEWENYAHRGLELIHITSGTVLRNPYRATADNPYRLTPEIGHRNQGLVFAPGTDVFVTFTGRPIQVQLLPPERKFWIAAWFKGDRQQWFTQIPSPIRASPPSGRINVVGVDQSLFLKTPLAPGRYQVDYSFSAMTMASAPVPITKQVTFFVEIYCPTDTKCS